MNDLNLLKVFDAMMQTNNVTKTAEMLNKTPSAISQSLSRLRQEYDNEILFIKEGKEMKPTAFANELYEEIKESLEVIKNSKRFKADFDPLTSKRTFRINSNSLIDILYASELRQIVKKEAPNVRIEIQGFNFGGEALHDSLRLRKADLILNLEPLIERSYDSKKLITIKPIVMCSKAHPRIGDTITQEDFIREEHATWIAGNTSRLIINQAEFRDRKVAYTSDSFFNVFKMVAETDLIALSAPELCEKLNMDGKLKILEIPFELPEVSINMTWHLKSNEDNGLSWLRSKVEQVFKENKEK